VRVKH